MQCAEERRHVPESLYPFTYNPKMSLNLSQVPSSSQRSPPLTRTQLKDISEAKDETVSPLFNFLLDLTFLTTVFALWNVGKHVKIAFYL